MTSAGPSIVYTIGHSTRTFEAFRDLLRRHGITRLADIRRFPRSRRHPQFNDDRLASELAAADIAYRHFADLGGRRSPRPDSPNGGWRDASFRGYADYMATPAFREALDELIAWASVGPTAIMCAEATWWRCHRMLVSDALVARGIEVRHVLTDKGAERHRVTPFAVISDEGIQYPGLLDSPGTA